ncbi:MAG: hypothetical protein QM741_15510 [Rudaea sp.]|uniref:HVO_A0114 family putative DNA-binding protein n=1 Tax=Rudaea sp. TaxID=2136325 RepID=UPI0039E5F0B0
MDGNAKVLRGSHPCDWIPAVPAGMTCPYQIPKNACVFHADALLSISVPNLLFAVQAIRCANVVRTLTPKRWELLKALTGTEPLGVRELARRVKCDVKAVHTDAQALAVAGVVDKTEDGKLSFPYDAVPVDFTLEAA